MASSELISDDDGSSKNVALHADFADSPSSENESQQAGDNSSDNQGQDAEDLNSNVAADVHTSDASNADGDAAEVKLIQWLENLDAIAPRALSAARIPDNTDVQSFPFRVSTAGPPPLSTKLQKGIVRQEFDPPSNDWTSTWQMEPDIDIIRNMIKPYALFCGLPSDSIEVEFLAEGVYNKVYTVQAVNPLTGAIKEVIFRCAMPDFPWYRVQAEISTMELVRHHTTISVPKIYVFDSSMENALGLEWMLMEKIPGQTLSSTTESGALSFESKVKIYETVADWVDQLSRINFNKMGSIFHDWNKPLSDISSYDVGPMVFDDFNYDLRLDFPVTRGPFASRREFHRARLDFNLAEALDPRMKERAEYWTPRHEVDAAFSDMLQIRHHYQLEMHRRARHEKDEREAKLKYMGGAVRPKPDIPPNDGGRHARLKAAAGPEDEELEECSNALYDLEAIAAMPSYCMRLQHVLPSLFPDPPFAPQSCALHHPDLHDENILVDPASGTALALIDWEKCFASPVRYIARYPKLIVTEDDDDEAPKEPEPWMADEWRIEYERQRQKRLEDARLRETFDGCLEQRASPFLAPREDADDDSPERLLNQRIWDMAKFCCEKDEVLEGWEKMARESVMGL